MKSNYKMLAPYIRQVDVRNNELRVTRLLGVSIEKKFIESIANTIGTDMTSYKIVHKGQFAYGPVTSRNGDKVSIALLEEDECIISSSYIVFEIIDRQIILPEYLNLWFKRPEFDRYARFHSHGSAREIFDWDEMCNVELPIPDIEEQQKIVDSYKTIEKRISILRKINDNLESQAIAQFDELFMKDIESTDLIFGSYVSFLQGTQIPVEDQLSENEPNSVRFVRIVDYTTDGKEPPRYIYPPHNATSIDETEVAVVRYGNIGLIGRRLEGIIANNLFKVMPRTPTISNHYIYYFLRHPKIQTLLKSSEGSSAMPAIKHSTVANLPINRIDSNDLSVFNDLCNNIEALIRKNKSEIEALSQLQKNILSSVF